MSLVVECSRHGLHCPAHTGRMRFVGDVYLGLRSRLVSPEAFTWWAFSPAECDAWRVFASTFSGRTCGAGGGFSFRGRVLESQAGNFSFAVAGLGFRRGILFSPTRAWVSKGLELFSERALGSKASRRAFMGGRMGLRPAVFFQSRRAWAWDDGDCFRGCFPNVYGGMVCGGGGGFSGGSTVRSDG